MLTSPPDVVTDPIVLERWDEDHHSADPLGFRDYVPPAAEDESVRTALVSLASREAVWIDCAFARQGGTMGSVAGDRIVQAFDRATDRGLPVVQTVSSGGARLQEGMVSLVQMARAASAAARHAEAGLMTAAYLHSPCTGGVFASWASLADVRAAEPGATIGFGGPRVVAQVTGQFPPPTSHRAESALEHGLVDAVVPVEGRWEWLASAVGAATACPLVPPGGRAHQPDRSTVPADPYELLVRCRSHARPSGLEWAAWLTDSWVELRGADPSFRAGLATVSGQRVVVVAMDRFGGRDGAQHPTPDAFRLAQRALTLADRLRLPVLTLIDTPGADPSPASEAAGIAGEIARTLLAMARLRSPSVGLVVGEGGSGGAIALAHSDRLLMTEGAVFSVIGPEAGAAILYRDAERAPELTRDLRMTAADLQHIGVVDAVVAEDVAAVRRAVVGALATAVPGQRDQRIDAVTARSTTRTVTPTN
ncbi:hypothetical protein ASG88_17680 [Nocardioides sp. Soil777]|nr:hypothetical protein ASG88_17680 [Nocardioides sp. Soil777]